MRLINRYIVAETVKYLFLSLLSVLCIFVAVDYLGTMDEFIEAKISLWRAFQFVILKIPFICTQSMPVILLLAILISFGLMSKRNELIILNSSGISIFAVAKPVLAVAAATGLIVFYLAEQVVPLTMQQANAIQTIEIRKKTNVKVKERNIWIRGNRQITHIQYFNPARRTINGFTRFYFDDAFRLSRRLDARSGHYDQNRWQLFQCMDQRLDVRTNTYAIRFHDRLDEKLDLHPDDFRQIVRKSEEMTYRDLSEYVRKVEGEGYDATAYRVDLYAKVAYPFVCIIMAMVAIGLTARRRLNKGLPISITYGIGIGFLYFVFHSFCISLGYGGILPAMVAAWTANFLFLCAGFILVLNAE